MYYDTYRGKRGGKNRRGRGGGCTGWLLGTLLKLIALVLVAVVLAAGVLFAIPPSFMNIEPGNAELSLTDGLPSDRVNVLLLGVDFLEDGQQRSDAMMIASVGYNSIHLTSIMRDTMVDIPGYGRHKLNSAYSYGGAEMAMRVVNETFKLNITNYIVVDFSTMVDLVDAIGGVDVEIEDKELEHLNKYAYDTFKKINAVNPEKYGHYINSQPYTQGGTLHLNGLFATGYSRIRLIDTDYKRAQRQRRVILLLDVGPGDRLVLSAGANDRARDAAHAQTLHHLAGVGGGHVGALLVGADVLRGVQEGMRVKVKNLVLHN